MEPIVVNVAAGGGYNVYIGKGTLSILGAVISHDSRTAAVITDSSVDALYYKAVKESVESAGLKCVRFVFPAGEASKSAATFSDILEFLADSGLTREDCILALGGGVVGDLAGFAAGCYMRGIDCYQIPTTLLSAVDSSVGGKTAIDLKAGKNLAGVFWQPKAVICDTSCLDTLPDAEFSCGMAEVIKTGVLDSEALFSAAAHADRDDMDELIAKCVRFKADTVARDEKELGERKLLNLGHTFGHAIEKLSGYRAPHGFAVAAGICIAARAAEKCGVCRAGVSGRIESAVSRFGLPVSTGYSARELSKAMLADKKRRGDEITFVLPERIGKCILKNIPVSETEGFVSSGLEA